ncbi:hypothetical protein, partial [Novosphingobium sp. AP12]|uniref:hypothetical protein n=1 Tax=Novosphingobium sp. AP12 TaxID=1144305 RepID=UPI00056BBC91
GAPADIGGQIGREVDSGTPRLHRVTIDSQLSARLGGHHRRGWNFGEWRRECEHDGRLALLLGGHLLMRSQRQFRRARSVSNVRPTVTAIGAFLP